MSEVSVSREVAEGVATLTLHRPEAGAALTRAVWRRLGDAVDAALADSRARAILLAGAGDGPFAAGGDPAELAALDPAGALELALAAQAACDRLERGGKPVVAAIDGPALGPGCELALACHLRVMTRDASLGLPQAGLGLIPGYGGMQRLARLVGRARALEVVLTGRRVSAAEAVSWGLAVAAVPQPELRARAGALLELVLAQGPVAVRLALEAVTHGLELALEDGAYLEASLFALALSTEDAREGLRAAAERRAPRFSGR